MVVGFDQGGKSAPARVHAEPGEGRLGEKQVRALLRHTILQQAVSEDDIDTGHLPAAAHQVPQEAAVMHDDFEIEIVDASTRATRAGVVGCHLALDPLEGDEGVVENVEESRAWLENAVRSERED